MLVYIVYTHEQEKTIDIINIVSVALHKTTIMIRLQLLLQNRVYYRKVL